MGLFLSKVGSSPPSGSLKTASASRVGAASILVRIPYSYHELLFEEDSILNTIYGHIDNFLA